MMYSSLPQSFFVGECFDAYRILGAHPAQGPHGEEGWRFTVWAPGATAVEICGGFDGWGPGVPMEKADTGLWSGFIAGLAEGDPTCGERFFRLVTVESCRLTISRT